MMAKIVGDNDNYLIGDSHIIEQLLRRVSIPEIVEATDIDKSWLYRLRNGTYTLNSISFEKASQLTKFALSIGIEKPKSRR
ncbi:hypothetical protein [Streptococcus sp. zg-JUN1979]|uniref:hypothetical protein n=1 Tax=Streptococcus sp. zg-JUN1979 TaxID=3391450 RepID=UPI0039AF291B